MTAQLALPLDGPSEPVRIAEWNTRWLRCCADHGVRPEATRPVEIGFVAWSNIRWLEWCDLRRARRDDPRTPGDHADYDAWLAERYPYPWPVE